MRGIIGPLYFLRSIFGTPRTNCQFRHTSHCFPDSHALPTLAHSSYPTGRHDLSKLWLFHEFKSDFSNSGFSYKVGALLFKSSTCPRLPFFTVPSDICVFLVFNPAGLLKQHFLLSRIFCPFSSVSLVYSTSLFQPIFQAAPLLMYLVVLPLHSPPPRKYLVV